MFVQDTKKTPDAVVHGQKDAGHPQLIQIIILIRFIVQHQKKITDMIKYIHRRFGKIKVKSCAVLNNSPFFSAAVVLHTVNLSSTVYL